MTDPQATTIYERLSNVQADLKAPKNKKATAGAAKYNYRSCEDILEAVKPILKEHGLVLTMSDDLIHTPSMQPIISIDVKSYEKTFTEIHGGDRFYIQSTATVYDFSGASVSNFALARETQVKRGMDDSQITGSASSYARKYALSGLFGIDDTKDADADEYRQHDDAAAVTPRATPTPISNKPAPLHRFNEDDKQTLLDTIAGASTDSEWGDLTKFMLSKQDARHREAGVCLLMDQAPTLEILRRINNYLAKPEVKGRTGHTDAAFAKRQEHLPDATTQAGIA